jgi:hypothetical protein
MHLPSFHVLGIAKIVKLTVFVRKLGRPVSGEVPVLSGIIYH